MEIFDKIIEMITQYWYIAVLVLDSVMRIWPSDKVRSIFSILGKILKGLGDIFFLISDALSKYVPDNPNPEE